LGVATEVVDDSLVVDRARELADRIAGYPVRGRVAMNKKWKELRGEIADPPAWFTDLLAL
jgi:hypothetical protein